MRTVLIKGLTGQPKAIMTLIKAFNNKSRKALNPKPKANKQGYEVFNDDDPFDDMTSLTCKDESSSYY